MKGMSNTRLRKSSCSRVAVGNSLAENNIEHVSLMKIKNQQINRSDKQPTKLIQNSPGMIIKIAHGVLPVRFAHLVNPLDKEKSTFPHMVGVKHPRH